MISAEIKSLSRKHFPFYFLRRKKKINEKKKKRKKRRKKEEKMKNTYERHHFVPSNGFIQFRSKLS